VVKSFFPEGKTSEGERESGHSPGDDHTETNVFTYENECGTDPVKCLLTVSTLESSLHPVKCLVVVGWKSQVHLILVLTNKSHVVLLVL
jgi:hypothetical protein